jgi:hypothetical protein
MVEVPQKGGKLAVRRPEAEEKAQVVERGNPFFPARRDFSFRDVGCAEGDF